MENKNESESTKKVEKIENAGFETTTETEDKKRGRKIFKIKTDGIDYRQLNFFVKSLGGVLLILLGFFTILFIGRTVLGPISNILSLLTPFILGIVFAWLLNPVVSAIDKKNKKKTRKRASILVVIAAFITLSIVIFGMVIVVTNTVLSFFTGGYGIMDIARDDELSFVNIDQIIEVNLNNPEEEKESLVNVFLTVGEAVGVIYYAPTDDCSYFNNAEIECTVSVTKVYQINAQALNITAENIQDAVMFAVTFITTYILTTMIVAFLLPGFRNFSNVVKSIIPKKYKEDGSELIDIIGSSFNSYMRGALKIASILGGFVIIFLLFVAFLCNTIFYEEGVQGLFIVKESSYLTVFSIILVFGVVAAVTNLVPYIGPFIGGTIIVSLVLFTDTSEFYWVSIAVLVMFVLVQSLESLFLQPIVMGRETKLPPVIILAGITVFFALFGLVGLFIATPITSVIRSVIQYYDDQYEIF